MDTEGYKGHRAGSAKERVHKVFDEKGRDAAIKKAVALGKQETTARTWCSAWQSGVKKRAPAKVVAKKTVKAKTPAKKVAKVAKKAAPKKPGIKRERVTEQPSA